MLFIRFTCRSTPMIALYPTLYIVIELEIKKLIKDAGFLRAVFTSYIKK